MGAIDEKKRELDKLLESIIVSGSSFESADLARKIAKITEELKEDSKSLESATEESK